MDIHFGTEEETISGAFTLSQTNWPEGARYRLARAQNVAADRANALRQVHDTGGDEAAKLEVQSAFDEAIAAYRTAMLALFDLEDTARHTART